MKSWLPRRKSETATNTLNRSNSTRSNYVASTLMASQTPGSSNSSVSTANSLVSSNSLKRHSGGASGIVKKLITPDTTPNTPQTSQFSPLQEFIGFLPGPRIRPYAQLLQASSSTPNESLPRKLKKNASTTTNCFICQTNIASKLFNEKCIILDCGDSVHEKCLEAIVELLPNGKLPKCGGELCKIRALKVSTQAAEDANVTAMKRSKSLQDPRIASRGKSPCTTPTTSALTPDTKVPQSAPPAPTSSKSIAASHTTTMASATSATKPTTPTTALTSTYAPDLLSAALKSSNTDATTTATSTASAPATAFAVTTPVIPPPVPSHSTSSNSLDLSAPSTPPATNTPPYITPKLRPKGPIPLRRAPRIQSTLSNESSTASSSQGETFSLSLFGSPLISTNRRRSILSVYSDTELLSYILSTIPNITSYSSTSNRNSVGSGSGSGSSGSRRNSSNSMPKRLSASTTQTKVLIPGHSKYLSPTKSSNFLKRRSSAVLREASPTPTESSVQTVTIRMKQNKDIAPEKLTNKFLMYLFENNKEFPFSYLLQCGNLRLTDILSSSTVSKTGPLLPTVCYLFQFYIVIWIKDEGKTIILPMSSIKFKMIQEKSTILEIVDASSKYTQIWLSSDISSIIEKWIIALSDSEFNFPSDLITSTINSDKPLIENIRMLKQRAHLDPVLDYDSDTESEFDQELESEEDSDSEMIAKFIPNRNPSILSKHKPTPEPPKPDLPAKDPPTHPKNDFLSVLEEPLTPPKDIRIDSNESDSDSETDYIDSDEEEINKHLNRLERQSTLKFQSGGKTSAQDKRNGWSDLLVHIDSAIVDSY